jgi:hypothetical protein
MKKIIWGSPDFKQQLQALYERPAFPPAAEEAARQIIAGVRERGDAALTEYAERFDHARLTPEEFFMPLDEAKKIAATLPAADKRAIRQALKQVSAFAKLTIPHNWMKTVRPGVRAGEKFTPMERVGVYIPGGTAPLVSTVIHTAGIAKAAGVKEIVAITPPGNMHPAVLYAMLQAGVTSICRLGGVYGIAANIPKQVIKTVSQNVHVYGCIYGRCKFNCTIYYFTVFYVEVKVYRVSAYVVVRTYRVIFNLDKVAVDQLAAVLVTAATAAAFIDRITLKNSTHTTTPPLSSTPAVSTNISSTAPNVWPIYSSCTL